MKYKENWSETKTRWQAFWKRENTGLPLMSIVARKPETEAAYQKLAASGQKMYSAVCQGEDPSLPDELMYKDMDDKYQNAQRMVLRYRHFCETHVFMADSFPNINVDFGPGSIAAYVGCDITFNNDTVWFQHFVDEWEDQKEIKFDENNFWWQKHLKLVKDVAKLSNGDFYVGVPDLMENLDILASLRGAQNLIFDIMDEPEEVQKRIKQVDEIYFKYYNQMYEVVKNKDDDGSAYTVFQIWGKGKTAKIQCDFGAMISPLQFREFVQNSLRKQAKQLDNVLFHLDGADCIRHLDAILEIDEIDALQWTSGDHGPDGTLPDWYEIYDKARKAHKSIWIKVYSGEFEDWVKNADRMVKRYGSCGTFLMFPELSMQQADALMTFAKENWCDVAGEFGV